MWSLQITWYLLCSVLVLPLLCEDPSEGAGGEEGFLSRVLGLPGVWWPHTHIFSNAWSLLAAGLSSAVVGASFLPKLRRSDVDQATERVFRGVVAQPHSWPWIAKLKTTFRRPGARVRRRACGGALIADRFVLTARHCVSWDHNGVVVDGRQVEVWLGSHGREGQDGYKIPVRRIIIRPDYQAPTCASGVHFCPGWAFWSHSTLTNDIAVVELQHPAPRYSNIRPIRMAPNPPPLGTTAWVGGWGLDGKYPTPELNLAPMSVQKDNFRECKQQQAPGKMCVLGKDAGGPCPGDSGSPLISYSRKAGAQLIGLVSNGAASCRMGLPGIFTRVSHYYDWIHVAMDTAARVGYGYNSPRRGGNYPYHSSVFPQSRPFTFHGKHRNRNLRYRYRYKY